MPDSARQDILDRINSVLGSIPSNADREWEHLGRDYIQTDSLSQSAIIALFEHRLLDYGARIFHCSSDLIEKTVAEILIGRGAKKIVIPAGLPEQWLPDNFDFTQDVNLSFAKLDQFDGVMTRATAAIAATGSIVLQHGPGEGRRALTLIPDYHLCIVNTGQVVETVPAAFSRLDSMKPTTFISGPSATADIEMTRIKGVHGPRFMDVVLVDAINTG